MGERALLELRDIVKTFPGVRALDGAHFDLRAGEVHALVGENGAGKTTLMNIVAGVLRPDSGKILLDGRPVSFSTPHKAAQAGMAVVFQELSLAPNLSIAENIFAHRQPVRWGNLVHWKALHEQTRRLLKLFELDPAPSTLVKDLSVAQKQVVEVLKAMSHEPRVLILDEPTSSLTAIETRLLFQNIRMMRESGVGFIYISHHLAEIFQVADRVTVMRDGRYVETFDVANVTEDKLIRRMVGRELSNVYGPRPAALGEEFFRIEKAGRGDDFDDISLSLRRGEIVALAGLVGAGRTELSRAIAGIEPLDRGRMFLDGREIHIRNPQQAIRAGVAYLTEDRKEQGLFLRMALRDNCAAPSLGQFANSLGWMRDGRVRQFAESCRTDLNIVASSTKQRVANLSGGNQQKVLLGMWMGTRPRLLIVDEPTRGVDVGARSEIYGLLRRLCAKGVGILLISSDLQEVLGLADRIIVMRAGRAARLFGRSEASEESIIAAAAGVELT